MSASLEALVGTILADRYRLDTLLGAGGMGAVYRAAQVAGGPDVAIKLLHPDIGSDASVAKRFDREALSASRLDHPHCVRVSDFGSTDEGVKYLVMELLEGQELAAGLGQPWPPDEALTLLEQLLAGLEHAHGCGIVHRDLKPENVFMTRVADGPPIAKIVDFGIAKLLDSDGAVEVLTRAGMVFGTPRYMSPEQAAGGKVDERSDLYAVGILAHELLAGKPPFDGDDLAAILRMQIIVPPPPLPASVPAPIAAFVACLLEKSRHERPDSATAALATVRSLRSAGPLGASSVDGLGATGELPAEQIDGPLPSKPEAMIGHRVAKRFVLEALLGVGGMGAVFRARDDVTGTAIAVKLLHAALAGDEELAARFEREAETASALEHPNIVPVFSHGTTPGAGGPAPYLIMPLLEGVELRALIGAPLDPRRAVELLTQLLAALAHAHGHGVVHRDLKPENVFVIRDEHDREQVQLVDFGLAKVAEGGSRRALTQFGQVFGTPAYMSPEQCRGEIVDARTDLYAAGVIAYELLAGRPPFDSDDPIALLHLQLEAAPPPLPDHVPPALREVVAGLLVKHRDARIPDATTAMELVQRAATLAPVVPAGPPAPGATMFGIQGPIEAPGVRRSKPPLWAWVAGGVAALVVIIAVWPNPESGSSVDSDSDRDRDSDPLAAAASRGADWVEGGLPGGLRSGPDTKVYVAIDRELSARDGERALELIRTARDEFPEDGGLLWREGRALALDDDDAQRVTALHRYAEALSAEPTLADETEFAAELRNLLRDPDLRTTAIDVAVRKLGATGHSFLLESLNDTSVKLSYVDRQRVLAELRKDPLLLSRVDQVRQLDLDLRQAATAPAPCTAFAHALERIEESGDPAYLAALISASLEVPTEAGVGEDPDDCAGLDVERERVKATLAAEHPEEAAKQEQANRTSKKSGSKKKFRFPF